MATRAKLGEILREAGLLDAEGLKRALARKAETGKRLGETLVELLSQHLHAKPTPPSELLGHAVSPDLEALILSCLEKDRELRPRPLGESQQGSGESLWQLFRDAHQGGYFPGMTGSSR